MLGLRRGCRRTWLVARPPWSVARLSTGSARHRVVIPLPDNLKEFQLKGSRPLELHVRPSLSNELQLETSLPDAFRVTTATQSTSTSIRVEDSEADHDDGTLLYAELYLPPQIDLNVSIVQGKATLHDKIEGNVSIAVSHGDISVDKVRGNTLRLASNDGAIHVKTLVEGDKAILTAKQIDCKRLMAQRADITLARHPAAALNSSFGALYTSLATIQSAASGNLSIGNVHGGLDIRSDGMAEIHVGSVNGSLFVEDTGDNCNLNVHFDAIAPSTDDTSTRLVVGGNARISVAPSLELGVDLHASAVETPGCAFDDGYELDQLEEDYVVATGTLKPTADAAVASTMSSGKINLNGAKASAMTTSFFSQKTADDTTSQAQLFVHAINGKVILEQKSWMDKIRDKHAALKKD
ncbi:unnamed protein product [Aphanomyces euteiches]